MVEDRITALRRRVTQHADEGAPEKTQHKSKRRRHTLYLDNNLVKQVDQAFKDAVYALHPKKVEIEKADYLEALLTYGLAHQDDILSALTDKQS